MSLLEDIEASRYTPIDILTTLLRDAEAGKIFDIIVVSRLRPDEGEESWDTGTRVSRSKQPRAIEIGLLRSALIMVEDEERESWRKAERED